MPRNGTISDLIAGLQKKANLGDEAVQRIRVYEVHSGKIYKELKGDFNVAGVNEFVTLFAETIPEEELDMKDGDWVINAFNFDRDPGRPHGVPFKFVVKPVSRFWRGELYCKHHTNEKAGGNLQRNEATAVQTNWNQGQAV